MSEERDRLERPAGARPVLDNHGWVAYIDHMGGDEAIERAARQSYGDKAKKRRNTRNLIRYLLRNRHDSPFESCEIVIQFRVPLFVARQMFRHRLMSPNEISGRYVVLEEAYYVPSLEQICYQSKDNKQGRGEAMPGDLALACQQWIQSSSEHAFGNYHALLKAGVANETARIVLPLNTYTVFTFKGNLRTWLHFLHLRLHHHAQWEVRQVAKEVAAIVQEIAPEAYAAWEEYTYGATTLSRTLKRLIARHLDLDGLTFDFGRAAIPGSEWQEFQQEFQQELQLALEEDGHV